MEKVKREESTNLFHDLSYGSFQLVPELNSGTFNRTAKTNSPPGCGNLDWLASLII